MWGNGPYQRITETITDIHELVVERLAPGAGRRAGSTSPAGPARSPSAPLRPGASVTGRRPRARADRDGEGAGRRARARHRLPGRRRRAARRSRTRASTRSPRPAGSCSRPTTRRPRASSRGSRRRRADRARELDARGRPGEDVQGDGAVPAGAAAEQPVRLGRRGPRARAARRRVRARDRGARLDAAHAVRARTYWELFSTSYGPTKTLAESLGDRREELHRDWVDFFETNYRSTARSRTRASTCSCSEPGARPQGRKRPRTPSI